ncbi:MAG: calcineurin-like phosphoesterase C-terminal domain-containing protein [Rubripirellula sp.]
MTAPFRFVPCLALLATALLSLHALGHEGADSGDHSHATPDTGATEIAKGTVFDDRNGNGKRDEGEPGLPDIRVSNGADIVQTDANGNYELPVTQDTIIFVIKPRDWVTPLNRDNLPQFYYIHKPAGSPANFRFAGVDPTGPLPKSIDFPLRKRVEPNKFKAIMFGDPQPRNVEEVEFMAHDVVEQIIAAEAHDAAFGVTLGDIVFDDLSVMKPHNQAIALIGIPWYNVIGNHDLNLDAKDDAESDETFERIYGPTYYSFDHGPAHFLVLDDVHWHLKEGKGHYHGGFGPRQMEFIRNDLALLPKEQLVVLLMHIPLNDVKDRQELYRLIEQRPATVSLSAHTHYMEHRFIGSEDGWKGPKKHHHIVNVTVCGSWWRGKRDERGIPHATMSDGGPNGYTIMEFDGDKYSLELRAASRPEDYQMNIYCPEVVAKTELFKTVVLANVFNGTENTAVAMRLDRQGKWLPMEATKIVDPAFVAEKEREKKLQNRDWTDLPGAHSTPHMWRSMLPTRLSAGTHMIEIRATDPSGNQAVEHRILRVENSPQAAGVQREVQSPQVKSIP